MLGGSVMKRLAFVGVIALLAACSAGPSGATTPPGATPPAAATSAPNPPAQATSGAPQPNAGDNASRGQALIPPGATQLSEISSGNAYSVQVSSTQSLEQLGAFWTQAIPAAGLQETGRFTADETLTIAFTNPDGGIVAAADPSAGGVIITISVGTQ